MKNLELEIPLSIPYLIPEKWVWTRLSNLGTLIRGNGIKRDETSATGEFPCIRYGEIYTTYNDCFDIAKSFTSSELYNKSIKILKNDIIMTLTGENKIDIAKAITYIGEKPIACGGDLLVLKNYKCNGLYLVYVLNSPYSISRKQELATGDIIVHMSSEKINQILIPLPPLQEQERIIKSIKHCHDIIDS